MRNIAPMWAAQGIQVTVYCRRRSNGRRGWREDGVYCRWTPGAETKSISTLSYGLTHHLDASRRDFDAALVLNIANGFYLPLLTRRGIGVALNTDGIEWERGKWGSNARRVFRAGARCGARSADVLIADSKAIGEIWENEFNVSSEFIPYGAPVPETRQSDRLTAMDLVPEEYVLIVARMTPENNVDLTLDALEKCGPVPAVVVGDSNYDSPTEARLSEMRDAGRVRWLGHVQDQELLSQLWANAGIYVHGHSVGGTNPALLQALGAGAPTIALDTVFNREVIGADEQLYPADSDYLARLIRETITSAERRRSWRERGRQIIRSHYSWPDIAERYLDALDLAMLRRQKT